MVLLRYSVMGNFDIFSMFFKNKCGYFSELCYIGRLFILWQFYIYYYVKRDFYGLICENSNKT